MAHVSDVTGLDTRLLDLAGRLSVYDKALMTVWSFSEVPEPETIGELMEMLRAERESELAHIVMAITGGTSLQWEGGALDASTYNQYATVAQEAPEEVPRLTQAVDHYITARVETAATFALLSEVFANSQEDMPLKEAHDLLKMRADQEHNNLIELCRRDLTDA